MENKCELCTNCVVKNFCGQRCDHVMKYTKQKIKNFKTKNIFEDVLKHLYDYNKCPICNNNIFLNNGMYTMTFVDQMDYPLALVTILGGLIKDDIIHSNNSLNIMLSKLTSTKSDDIISLECDCTCTFCNSNYCIQYNFEEKRFNIAAIQDQFVTLQNMSTDVYSNIFKVQDLIINKGFKLFKVYNDSI